MNDDLFFHVKAFLLMACCLLLYPALVIFLMSLISTTSENIAFDLNNKQLTLPLLVASYILVSIMVFLHGKITKSEDHILSPFVIMFHLIFFLSIFIYELGKIPSLVFKKVWNS